MRRITIATLLLAIVSVGGCEWFDKTFGGKKEPQPTTSSSTTSRPANTDPKLAGVQIDGQGATSAPTNGSQTSQPKAGVAVPPRTSQPTSAGVASSTPGATGSAGAGLSYKYGQPQKGTSSSTTVVGKPAQHPDAGKTKAPSKIDRPVRLTDLVEGADQAKSPQTGNLEAENIDAAQPSAPRAVPSNGVDVVGPVPSPTPAPVQSSTAGQTPAPPPGKNAGSTADQPTSPLQIVARGNQISENKEPQSTGAIQIANTNPPDSPASSPKTPVTSGNETAGRVSSGSGDVGIGGDSHKTPTTKVASANETKEPVLIKPLPADADIGVNAIPSSQPSQKLGVGQTEIVEASIVQVGKRVFTIDNVLGGAADQLSALPKSSEETFRSDATKIISTEINRLVTHEMILAEARVKLTEEQVKEIDKEMDEVKRDMVAEYGTERALREATKARGRSLDDVLEEHRGELMIQVYLQYKFVPMIIVNREMLLKYYKDHKGEFSSPKKVQMQTICLPFAEFLPKSDVKPTQLEISAAKAKAREQVNFAAAELMSGADFGAVATKYSRGSRVNDQGLWPVMPAGSFKEAKVETVAFSLPEGKVSPIIETDGAFYIVKTVKIEEGFTKSFEEAQGQIEVTLRKEQHNKLASEYFDKLQKKSHENYSQNFLQLAVDRAVERYFRGRASTLR